MIELEELKARAVLIAAVLAAACLGFAWFYVVPGTVAEVLDRSQQVRQGDSPEWNNFFMRRMRRRGELPPPPLPDGRYETLAGGIGAFLGVVVAVGIFAWFQSMVVNCLALVGFVLGPLAGEAMIRSLTRYSAGNASALWCWLGVGLGLILGPLMAAWVGEQCRKGIAAVAGE